MNKSININEIEAFIFDFDGVLTNNLVYIDENAKELVSCNRSDGLAFDVLRKLKKPAFIVSSEKNKVVSSRAKKLKIQAIQGITDKVKAVKKIAKEKKINLEKILYVGNDVNDYYAMKLCGYSACPIDSHPRIKDLSKIVIPLKGGGGLVRFLLEEILNLDVLEILYKDQI